MTKRSGNPPKDPLERLPGWHKGLLDEHFKGLPGAYLLELLDQTSAAERSERGKLSADARHEARNKIKAQARAYYVKNRSKYNSNKAAAADLSTLFGNFKFRTYENLISKWSSE
jgi:hypothetical protein